MNVWDSDCNNFMDYYNKKRLSDYYYDIIRKNKGEKRMPIKFFNEVKELVSKKHDYKILYVPHNEMTFYLFFDNGFNQFRIDFQLHYSDSDYTIHDGDTYDDHFKSKSNAAILYDCKNKELLEQLKNDYLKGELD